MAWVVSPLVLLLLPLMVCGTTPTVDELKDEVDDLKEIILNLQTQVEQLGRSYGPSGITATRLIRHGSPQFTTATLGLAAVNSIHDHANNIRTLGMGEVDAMLNGVQFTTRHNDFKLRMPETISSGSERIAFGASVNIQFPEVPTNVTGKATVEEEVAEMKEYFKAFADQNITHRNYTDYFKPVLCYLEGYWIIPDASGNIVEPFDSDRHFIDASTYKILNDKMRHSFWSGRRDLDENFAWLPTGLYKDENGDISKAHWNYRIMCHPIGNTLAEKMSTNRFVPIDDIDIRCANRMTMEEHIKTRNARFRLKTTEDPEKTYKYKSFVAEFLDLLMQEIPGLDGYGNALEDKNLASKATMDLVTRATNLSGYYNRVYREQKGANGQRVGNRGYRDDNAYFAMNSQNNSMPSNVQKDATTTVTQKWSYAIPLEVIYLTPLLEWNPYNIVDHGEANAAGVKTTVSGSNEVNDGSTSAKAQNGTHSRAFYRTPWSFFDDPSEESNPALADTGAEKLYVKDNNGNVKEVAASGPRTFVWNARCRWPISPASWEGNAVHKQLAATRECEACTCNTGTTSGKLSSASSSEQDLSVSLKTTARDGAHSHQIILDRNDATDLWNKVTDSVRVFTVGGEHQHSLTLKLNWTLPTKPKLYYVECDDNGVGIKCSDKHPRNLQFNSPYKWPGQAYDALTNP